MNYLAGVFDAEGWVSLTPKGNFIIGVEITNETVTNLFQDKFGGKIYIPTRKAKKQVYSWRIPSNNELAINFLHCITQYTVNKRSQLLALQSYLEQPRSERRNSRGNFVHKISELKKPISYTKQELLVPQDILASQEFLKWFAGFMDGDGNFCVYEYENWRKRSFDSWISAFNTFAEPIIHIKKRIEGSISQYKGTNYPIWKWVCNQVNSQFVCTSLQSHLIIKKEQCRLVGEYLKIHSTKQRGIDYSDNDIAVIRDIIKQIKHYNSL